MNKIILKTVKIKKVFNHRNGKIELFKNVNLSIKAGELIALTGPSGSGKSSLLHLLALLDKPTAGKIFFLGKDSKNINQIQQDQIRQKKFQLFFKIIICYLILQL